MAIDQRANPYPISVAVDSSMNHVRLGMNNSCFGALPDNTPQPVPQVEIAFVAASREVVWTSELSNSEGCQRGSAQTLARPTGSASPNLPSASLRCIPAPPLLCAQQPHKSCHITNTEEKIRLSTETVYWKMPSGCGWIARRIKRSGSGAPFNSRRS